MFDRKIALVGTVPVSVILHFVFDMGIKKVSYLIKKLWNGLKWNFKALWRNNSAHVIYGEVLSVLMYL